MKSLRSLSQPSEFQRTGNAVNDMLSKRKKIKKKHISVSSIFNDIFKIRKPVRLYFKQDYSSFKKKKILLKNCLNHLTIPEYCIKHIKWNFTIKIWK